MPTPQLSKAQLKELAHRVVVTQGNAFIKELLRGTGSKIGASKEEFLRHLDAAIDDGLLDQQRLEAWLAEVEGWGRPVSLSVRGTVRARLVERWHCR